MTSAAPLTGIQVLVFAGLGPVPYAAMLLADFGACVIIIDRPEPAPASMPPGGNNPTSGTAGPLYNR